MGTAPSVDFDYTTDVNTYTNVVNAGGGTLAPTSVTTFEDIQVASRAGNWYIYTRSTPTSGFGAGSGFELRDVRVRRGAVSGLTRSSAISVMLNNWRLRTTWRAIAYGNSATQGWDSLGFNGYDYTIDIDGDEEPGDHSVTVTYLLFSP